MPETALGGIALAFVTAFVLSLIVTPITRRIAVAHGLVAKPQKDRWHKKPTALLGGVAVFVATSASLFAFGQVWAILPVWTAAAMMFLLGIADDVIGLRPATKLAGQIIAASALVFIAGTSIWTGSRTADALIHILWIVAITNAFNLLDNMDGLCSGIALIAAIAYVAAHPGPTESLILGAALAGALGGFLFYNFNPASIFLGDAGSLFIGFTLAGLTAARTEDATIPGIVSVVTVPVLLLLIPIIDTAFVAVARTLSGRAVSQGGRDHMSHRLVAFGFSERAAVLILCNIAAVSAITATLVRAYGFGNVNVVVVLLLIVLLLLTVQLARVRIYTDAGRDFELLHNSRYTPLLINLTYKRRIFEILLDFILIGFSYYAAYRLRWEGDEFANHFAMFIETLPAVIGCKIASLWICGVYRGVWRYFGVHDLNVHLRGVLLGTATSLLAVFYGYGPDPFPANVFVIDALVLLALLVGSRMSFRALGEFARRHRPATGRRVLIYGAGDAGVMLLRELLNNDSHGYHPVGFIDDDPRKHMVRIQGYRVLGNLDALEGIIGKSGAEVVIVSTDSLPDGVRDRLAKICFDSATTLQQFDVILNSVHP